jgi:predicted nucleotide-binding protein
MAEPNSLPARTSLEDIIALVKYLATKPMGATPGEAKSIIDAGVLNAKKLSAYKFWGLVEDASGRLKLKERGRLAAKNKGANLHEAMLEIIKGVPAYTAIVERAIHKKESTVTALEVATQWHEHFSDVASSNEALLNHQAVCYFQVLEGARLGTMIVGRKGSPTRFEFSAEGLDNFEAGASFVLPDEDNEETDPEDKTRSGKVDAVTPAALVTTTVTNNKVFITHGKNQKVLDQIKDIVAYGSYEPVVAKDRESAAKPVPDKVMDDMRLCAAAVIHVSAEGTYKDSKGVEHPKINDNVLIEIGAAMALYKRNFILVVEDGLTLPSNLQGLYECRYTGDELSSAATMKLLKAFREFRA